MKLNFFMSGPITATTLDTLIGETNVKALATNTATTSVNIIDGAATTCPSCNIF